MRGADRQSEPAVWHYRISAQLQMCASGFDAEPEPNAPLLTELKVQAEHSAHGSTLRLWPNASTALTLHQLVDVLQLTGECHALFYALPNSTIIAADIHCRYTGVDKNTFSTASQGKLLSNGSDAKIAHEQEKGDDRKLTANEGPARLPVHRLEIVALKRSYTQDNENNLLSASPKRASGESDTISPASDTKVPSQELLEGPSQGLPKNRPQNPSQTINYHVDICKAGLCNGVTVSQRLPLDSFHAQRLSAKAEHVLSLTPDGLLDHQFDQIALPTIEITEGSFRLSEAHLQLSPLNNTPNTHPRAHLLASLSNACTCFGTIGLLRLDLKLQCQDNRGKPLHSNVKPNDLHQIEVLQGQGDLQFTNQLGPWPAPLTIPARIVPKKGLLIGPFPTAVTPNLASSLNVIPTLTTLCTPYLNDYGLHELKRHQQYTQLRIIAHANLWVQAGPQKPILVRATLYFCLGSTPLFSLPIAFRPAPERLNLQNLYTQAALTYQITHLVEEEHELIADKIAQDHYALASFLIFFTDVLEQLNDIPVNLAQRLNKGEYPNARTEKPDDDPTDKSAPRPSHTRSWTIFWQAIHRLANYQKTSKCPGSISHSNRVLHEHVKQITQFFCRHDGAQLANPYANRVPLSSQFFALLRRNGARETLPNAVNSATVAPLPPPQIIKGHWADQILCLTLSQKVDVRWVRHYRVNIVSSGNTKDSTDTKGTRLTGQLINSQCCIPLLLGQTTSRHIYLHMPRRWQNIKTVSIQLLAYGDPTIYETPAVSHFVSLTEDLSISADKANRHSVHPLPGSNGYSIGDNELLSPLRPWIAHVSPNNLRLKWQTEPHERYLVRIKENLQAAAALKVTLDADQAEQGILLERTTFRGVFPYQLWVSIQNIDALQRSADEASQNSSVSRSDKAMADDPHVESQGLDEDYEPIFVSIPVLSVFRDIVKGHCVGCHWEQPRYPVSYYQAELFEITLQTAQETEPSDTSAALALPCFQERLPANCLSIDFEAISHTLKPYQIYEFRLRAKLPDDGGLFAWTPATVVTINTAP